MLDNGHLLDQVLKRSAILQRIAHKELGIISRTKSCWNSQKADILLSVQRLHCPGVYSNKGHGKLSIHFAADYPTIETFALLFLPISSVFTEQLQTSVKN